MNETEQKMEELLQLIRESKEFMMYQNLLQRVKEQPDLFRRIGEYRRRSLAVQMWEGEAFIHENNEVQKQFSDLQNNGLAGEFLAAEHQYIGMVKKLQNHFLEGVQIDTSFLDE